MPEGDEEDCCEDKIDETKDKDGDEGYCEWENTRLGWSFIRMVTGKRCPNSI